MNEQELDGALRFAIANRRLLRLTYHSRCRVAEPHDYGVLNGRPRLLVYQVRELDAARSTRIAGWRLLDVAKIEDFEVLDETFPGSRASSHTDHFSWDVVYARVE